MIYTQRSHLFFPMWPFLVLLFLCQGVAFGQQQQQPRLASGTDLLALYSLRSSLGLRSRDWPRKTDPCTGWTGITCRSGRVVGLNLSGLRRTRLGKLNPRFAVDGLQNLTLLNSFNSTGFALPGPIPDWFGSRLPSSVSVLDLRLSGINGTIPDSLGNLMGLVHLSLSGNSLSGKIPQSLGGLRSLGVLDLSGNTLSGSLPASLGSLLNVTDLSLSSNSLSGEIPFGLGTLRNLKTLVLSKNRLSGPVPGPLGDLSLLTTLDLGGNSLSGPLPGDLKSMRGLQVLDLSNNSLTGTLPDSIFSAFSKLQSLTLSHNSFSGALPDPIWSLSELRFIDVSYNKLNGTLPKAVININTNGAVVNISYNLYYGSLPSGAGKLQQRLRFLDISGNYFEGVVPFDGSRNVSVESNCFRNAANQRNSVDCTKFYADRGMVYEGIVPPNTNQTGSSGSSGHKSRRRLVFILVGIFGGLLVVGLILLLVLCLMKCRATSTRQREISPKAVSSRGGVPPPGISLNFSAVGDSFTYDQLLQATSNLGDTNLMKHGHSGDLYRGILESGAPVVVKKIDVSKFKREPYMVELDFFARASHTRLVPLLGCCLENENEKLLVYKYMPNGDLSNALFKKTGQEEGLQSLDWITRLKIAIGVAEALCYLHHECTPPLVHRDVQASSILLDDKFEVRLGSLSEVCAQEGEAHQSVITRFLRLSQSSEPGTSGSASATCAYDVYCLGKVLLELVTGHLGISGSTDASVSGWLEQTLPYISIYEKDLLTKILDPSLIVDEDLMEEVWAMAIVAKSCLNPKPSKRPQVKYILKALENPLKVVREDNTSNSARLRATSSRGGSWNAALFGSWRSSSDVASVSGPPREVNILKQSGTAGSQGSVGEQSFNRRRPSKEIFPEPSGGFHDNED